MTRPSTLFALFAAMEMFARPASAPAAPPRGFAGAGVAATEVGKLRNGCAVTDPAPRAWFIDGAVFVGGSRQPSGFDILM